MILEIRTYRVRRGCLAEFVRLMQETVPLLTRFGIDVVDAGASELQDEGDRAYLIRAFESLEERDRLETAFYSSREWFDGPQDSVLASIEDFHTVVLTVTRDTVDALRGLWRTDA